MPKEQNLKRGNPETQYRSGRVAVENGRKGGKASGKTRSLQATINKRIRENPELLDAICEKLETMFLEDGNLAALAMWSELRGESARSKEIGLKKQELKLKKEIAEMQNW